MASKDKNEIKDKAKRRALRVWAALADGTDPKAVVRHKLTEYSSKRCYFNWKGEHGVQTVTVWKDKNERVYTALH